MIVIKFRTRFIACALSRCKKKDWLQKLKNAHQYYIPKTAWFSIRNDFLPSFSGSMLNFSFGGDLSNTVVFSIIVATYKNEKLGSVYIYIYLYYISYTIN